MVQLKAQGYADQAVEFARQKQLKIIPLCPFAKSIFDKDPSIHDVLRHS